MIEPQPVADRSALRAAIAADARDPVERLLSDLGVAIGPDGAMTLANSVLGYVHHSTVPVAVAAYAQLLPGHARSNFPEATLARMVTKRPVMDGRESAALAAVCGADVPYVDDTLKGGPFMQQLAHVIARYQFDGLFFRDPDHPACSGIDYRPRGYDPRSCQTDPAAVAAWRRLYRRLSPARQMMAATIVWLYRGAPDKTWLTRVPCAWHGAEAIQILKSAGALADWAKLVALYPGW
jgi:hypothetical protein